MAGRSAERARSLAGPIGLAFLPVQSEAISAPEREAVIRFVEAQVQNLSRVHRVLLGIALALFAAQVWCQSGRGFLRLGSDRQRRAVEGWAYGRLGLLRHVMRVFRTTALFQYFELPAVRYRLAALGGGVPARPRRSGPSLALPVSPIEDRP